MVPHARVASSTAAGSVMGPPRSVPFTAGPSGWSKVAERQFEVYVDQEAHRKAAARMDPHVTEREKLIMRMAFAAGINQIAEPAIGGAAVAGLQRQQQQQTEAQMEAQRRKKKMSADGHSYDFDGTDEVRRRPCSARARARSLSLSRVCRSLASRLERSHSKSLTLPSPYFCSLPPALRRLLAPEPRSDADVEHVHRGGGVGADEEFDDDSPEGALRRRGAERGRGERERERGDAGRRGRHAGVQLGAAPGA